MKNKNKVPSIITASITFIPGIDSYSGQYMRYSDGSSSFKYGSLIDYDPFEWKIISFFLNDSADLVSFNLRINEESMYNTEWSNVHIHMHSYETGLGSVEYDARRIPISSSGSFQLFSSSISGATQQQIDLIQLANTAIDTTPVVCVITFTK